MNSPADKSNGQIPDDIDESLVVYSEERIQKVWDLRIRGVAIAAIAKAVGVSPATVYRDLKQIGKRYRDELVTADPVSLVTENLQWLDEMERVALYEVHSSDARIEKTIDPITGRVTEVRTPDPNKAKFYGGALKAREMKLRLMIDTGIIPTGDPNKMFRALEVYQDHEAEIVDERRTPEQIQESIRKLLTGGRHM